MSTSYRLPKAAPGGCGPKPAWLKIRFPHGPTYERVKTLLARSHLSTVCENSRCPNLGECWATGTATVLLMGDICTRACKFCHIKTGAPEPLDEGEIEGVAQLAKALSLRYVVLTSVDRDDIADGGASHFARAIEAVHRESPHTCVEVLIPDFGGKEEDIARVAKAKPAVVGHNIETVERLSPGVRDRRASYGRSLGVLSFLKRQFGAEGLHTKSSLMVGLGETEQEVEAAMADLRSAGVDILTVGQYLQPSPRHLPVERFVLPEVFEDYARLAKEKGFLYVASGPLVRSSYKAAELFMEGLRAR